MRVIYIDVLLLVNALINYFLILGTCFFTKETVRRGRFAFAAFLGSLFSLTVLMPKMHFVVALLVKAAGCATISLIAFGATSLRGFLRNCAALFLSSALFAGLIALLQTKSGSENLFVNNFGLYVQVKPLMLVLLAMVIYLLLCLYELLFKKPAQIQRKGDWLIRMGGKTVEVRLIADSGKSLKEPVSGKEVIILKRTLAEKMLTASQLEALQAFEQNNLQSGHTENCGAFSVVPFKTVAGEGVILAFKADGAAAKSAKNAGCHSFSPYIGFVKDEMLPECDGLIGTDMLED